MKKENNITLSSASPNSAKSTISRRSFVTSAIAGGSLLSFSLGMPQIARAANPKLVIVGGGPGGATVARYLAKAHAGAIDISLIEPNQNYVTCFFSNLYLGGLRSYESITHSYDKLSKDYGIKVIRNRAYNVNAQEKYVTLGDGSRLPYDRLVVSPGIDFNFNAYEGYNESLTEQFPHAYQAGNQTILLKNQLLEMEDGGTFLMVAPPNPYRCPPGPYERVSMVAYYLKQNKPKSKIIVLDPKDKFSKQGLFQEAWNRHYGGMVEWLSSEFVGKNFILDAKAKTITAEGEVYKGDVINIIPPQSAGKIAQVMGLTDDSGWCPIKDANNFLSATQENIYVLGDASNNGAMPKSAFSANSQAKVVATHIASELLGATAYPARFRNTCWSMLTDNDSVKVGANYIAEGNKTVSKDDFVSKTEESDSLRMQTKDEAYAWYDAISEDIFG